MDVAPQKAEPAHNGGRPVSAGKPFFYCQDSRFELDLDFFRFGLLFFWQGDLQDSLIHSGCDLFRINLVAESKVPLKTLVTELPDTVVVLFSFRILFPVALEGQNAGMKLNRYILYCHAGSFRFNMKRFVFFYHIDFRQNRWVIVKQVCSRETEKPVAIEKTVKCLLWIECNEIHDVLLLKEADNVMSLGREDIAYPVV